MLPVTIVVVFVVVVMMLNYLQCCGILLAIDVLIVVGLTMEISSIGIDGQFGQWVTIGYNWAYLTFAAGH